MDFSETWVIPSFIIMSLWRIGGSVIIYLAGLQSIPTECMRRRASMARAGGIPFGSITLPLLTPVILYNLVIGIINSFQVFTEAFVMTQGGPNNASLFYNLYLYEKRVSVVQDGLRLSHGVDPVLNHARFYAC